MSATKSFNQQCYDLLKQIPAGKVTTYKELARAMKSRAWRAVGHAMATNTQLITIPCHRVIRSDGSIGQYTLGTPKKVSLLQQEGVPVENNRVTHLDKVLHRFV